MDNTSYNHFSPLWTSGTTGIPPPQLTYDYYNHLTSEEPFRFKRGIISESYDALQGETGLLSSWELVKENYPWEPVDYLELPHPQWYTGLPTYHPSSCNTMGYPANPAYPEALQSLDCQDLTPYPSYQTEDCNELLSKDHRTLTGVRGNPRKPRNFKCEECRSVFTSIGHLNRHFNSATHRKNIHNPNKNRTVSLDNDDRDEVVRERWQAPTDCILQTLPENEEWISSSQIHSFADEANESKEQSWHFQSHPPHVLKAQFWQPQNEPLSEKSVVNNDTNWQPEIQSSSDYSQQNKEQGWQSRANSITETTANNPTQETCQDGVKPPYKCPECLKTFERTCYLRQHFSITHDVERRFKCPICGKKYASEKALSCHRDKHSGEKPNKCNFCPKQFNYKPDLKRHLYSHFGQKPFSCRFCVKSFIRKDHKDKHEQVHEKKINKINEIMMSSLLND